MIVIQRNKTNQAKKKTNTKNKKCLSRFKAHLLVQWGRNVGERLSVLLFIAPSEFHAFWVWVSLRSLKCAHELSVHLWKLHDIHVDGSNECVFAVELCVFALILVFKDTQHGRREHERVEGKKKTLKRVWSTYPFNLKSLCVSCSNCSVLVSSTLTLTTVLFQFTSLALLLLSIVKAFIS